MINKIVSKIRTYGLRNATKLVYDRMIKSKVPDYCEKRWKRFSEKPGFYGVMRQKRPVPLIVSLTTYPKRIEGIHYVIETLLTQTVKPDMVILWLAPSQFPNKEGDLPESLLCLRKYGLTIDWCNDTRSYKKLIPTLEKYPDAVIITTDDDMYYHPRMVERLYDAYLKEPGYIHCHRATKMEIEDGHYVDKLGGYDVYPRPSYLHKLTGCSGVLYPPHCFHEDITNEDLFMTLAPTNDDVWFWHMGALTGMRCNVVKHNYPALYFVKGSQEDSLSAVNNFGEHLFWTQFDNMLEHYPQLDILLREEWEREVKKID